LPLPWDGTLTVTVDGTTWTTQWATVNNRPAPIAVASDGTQPVTAVPRGLLDALRPVIAAMLTQQAGLWQSYNDAAQARRLRKLARAAGHRSRRSPYHLDELQQITSTYQTAERKGEDPAQAVYRAFSHRLPRALDDRIRRARQLGLLPPYQRRKTG
jgi:hypothetical protein